MKAKRMSGRARSAHLPLADGSSSKLSRLTSKQGCGLIGIRLFRALPPLLLPPLSCTQPCTELTTSCVARSILRDLRTAWISQILSLVTDHNPRRRFEPCLRHRSDKPLRPVQAVEIGQGGNQSGNLLAR